MAAEPFVDTFHEVRSDVDSSIVIGRGAGQ